MHAIRRPGKPSANEGDISDASRRSFDVRGEHRGVLRRQTQTPTISEVDLERHLLRASVSSLHAERLCCDRCKRTPLVGEVVYRMPKRKTICALCLPHRKDQPIQAIPVRHGEEIRAQRITPRPASDHA